MDYMQALTKGLWAIEIGYPWQFEIISATVVDLNELYQNEGNMEEMPEASADRTAELEKQNIALAAENEALKGKIEMIREIIEENNDEIEAAAGENPDRYFLWENMKRTREIKKCV